MTIAAGFATSDGILLCADSQYTGWEKVYKDKLFCGVFGTVMVSFALAGDDVLGKSIIDDCWESLSEIPSDEQTIWNVRKSIRRVIKRELRDFPETVERPKPQFLIGIGNFSTSVLFTTKEAAMPRVETYDFLGSGAYIAHYVMKSLNSMGLSMMTIENAVLVGLCILTSAKRNDSSCGGGSQFLVMPRMGGGAFLGPASVDLSDAYVDRFDSLARNLMMSVGNLKVSDKDFKEHLDSFGEQLTDLRREMVKPGSHYRAIIETLRQSGLSGLQAPTADPSRQPP
jgi:hypothetical protein